MKTIWKSLKLKLMLRKIKNLLYKIVYFHTYFIRYRTHKQMNDWYIKDNNLSKAKKISYTTFISKFSRVKWSEFDPEYPKKWDTGSLKPETSIFCSLYIFDGECYTFDFIDYLKVIEIMDIFTKYRQDNQWKKLKK